MSITIGVPSAYGLHSVYDFDGALHSLRHRLRQNDTEICGVYKQHYRGVTDVGVPNVGHRLSSQTSEMS